MFLLFETDLEFESYSQCSYCCCTKSVYEGNNEITLHCFTRHLYLTSIFSSSLFPRQATGKMTSDSAGTIPFTTRVCVLVCELAAVYFHCPFCWIVCIPTLG